MATRVRAKHRALEAFADLAMRVVVAQDVVVQLTSPTTLTVRLLTW